MPFDRKYVLCYGKYPLLLETRQRLLESAGYAAISTSDGQGWDHLYATRHTGSMIGQLTAQRCLPGEILQGATLMP
jgi:hypothetical protein